MAQSTVFHIVRRRPLSSSVIGCLAGGSAYAHLVEWRTEREDRLNDGSANDPTSSSVPGLPRRYDREALDVYWSGRPVSVAKRFMTFAHELGPRFGAYLWDFQLFPQESPSDEELQRAHAEKLRGPLTHLGPAFVKAGQQLSIRPDLVPPAVLKELQKLCDAVQPIEDSIAFQVMKEELQCENLSSIFDDLHLVASASLGQVYKAKLRETGQEVAIKVQRPDMLRSVSLDLFLLQKYGAFLDAFCTTFTEQPAFHQALFDNFARGSYSELDYENEAANQIHFKTELARRNCQAVVPSVFANLTTQRVLTTEWISGVKLADAPKEQIRKLIPVGVELFLIQLLDIGAFHADPHPGNLYVTDDGTLCLLDFGLCADVDERSRRAMTKAIVHLLTRDFDSLVSTDAKELGFLPEDLDTKELQPILTKILTGGFLESGSNLHNRKRKLMEISNELNEVFFKYPFSVPPFFALVTRGLGLLEGIALSGDPNFDIFQASYPYARRRAMGLMGARRFDHVLRPFATRTS